MIAAIFKKAKPCIVYWTGKSGIMTVSTRTYCNIEVSAADGVHQLPDKTKFCDECTKAVEKAEAAIG